MTVTGKTLVKASGSADSLTIDDSIFAGRVQIDMGKGDDTVALEVDGDALGPVTTLNGALQVKMGSGKDSVSVGVALEAGNSLVTNGKVRFDGGSGTDTLDALANGNGFALAPEIKKFETVT